MWGVVMALGFVLLYVEAESVALQIIVYLLAFLCLLVGGNGIGALDDLRWWNRRSARRESSGTGAGAVGARS